jgi:glycine rich protein
VRYLAAGGGGGGGSNAPGGGAGGLLQGVIDLPASGYPIVIGAGGNPLGTNQPCIASSGGDTTGLGVTAKGGGGGGGYGAYNGALGGSGGGAGTDGISGGGPGAGTAGQGNSGGTSYSTGSGGQGWGGGGGGAGGPGANGVSGLSGVGGPGVSSSISGAAVTYCVGGGNVDGAVQPANTGNGGNGRAAGAAGVFIISYNGTPKATGGTITQVGGNTIHTFTASGTFTVS